MHACRLNRRREQPQYERRLHLDFSIGWLSNSILLRKRHVQMRAGFRRMSQIIWNLICWSVTQHVAFGHEFYTSLNGWPSYSRYSCTFRWILYWTNLIRIQTNRKSSVHVSQLYINSDNLKFISADIFRSWLSYCIDFANFFLLLIRFVCFIFLFCRWKEQWIKS
jgi:hypothetical protein